MKASIQASALFILCMAVSVIGLHMIILDRYYYQTQFSLKQSMHESLAMAKEQAHPLALIEIEQLFLNNLKLRTSERLEYEVEIMGYHAEPYALRIRLQGKGIALFPFTLNFDEMMIEVNYE